MPRKKQASIPQEKIQPSVAKAKDSSEEYDESAEVPFGPNPMLARTGDTVLVRNGAATYPAIVINDFGGQNAPGAVSLVAFVLDIHTPNGVNTQYIPMAQHETDSISDSVLLNEPMLWWRGREESERVVKPKEEMAA